MARKKAEESSAQESSDGVLVSAAKKIGAAAGTIASALGVTPPSKPKKPKLAKKNKPRLPRRQKKAARKSAKST